MQEKVMRGWVHAVAVVLGIGAPAALTYGTLRTGANFEMVASPKKVTEEIEQSLATQGPGAQTVDRYIADNCLVHGQTGVTKGKNALLSALTRDGTLPVVPPGQKGKRVAVAGNVVMVYSTLPAGNDNPEWRIDIYRIVGGQVVEYWTATPSAPSPA